MTYLRNCWYMAAWAVELGKGMLARILLDEPVVMFRDRDGRAAALADRCPHRFAPLSAGTLDETGITCRYHGLRFGADGHCVTNPHGPPSPALRAHSYPLMEAHRAVWIWMGDPSRVSGELPLDLSFLDVAPDSAFSSGRILGRGDYRLYTDNILDLTHADFLHPDTLGGGTFTRTRAKIAERDGRLAIAWTASDDPPSPVMASRLGGNVERVDSWTEIEWAAPALMTLRSGATRVGRPRSEGASSHNLHTMTPATATSTHYFYAATRDYALGDTALNDSIAALRERIFSTEDEPMIAAQQERIGAADFFALGPALMAIDEGPVRARRLLERRLRAEAEDRS